jgi:hypothetical protein
MFSAYAPRHRCFIPGCDTDWSNSPFKNAIDASYTQFALPTEHQGTDMFKAAEAFDPCNMFEHTNPYNCQPESFDNSSIVACESFVYDLSIFPETLTTKWDLVSYTLKTRLVVWTMQSCNGRQAVMSALEVLVLTDKGLNAFSVFHLDTLNLNFRDY